MSKRKQTYVIKHDIHDIQTSSASSASSASSSGLTFTDINLAVKLLMDQRKMEKVSEWVSKNLTNIVTNINPALQPKMYGDELDELRERAYDEFPEEFWGISIPAGISKEKISRVITNQGSKAKVRAVAQIEKNKAKADENISELLSYKKDSERMAPMGRRPPESSAGTFSQIEEEALGNVRANVRDSNDLGSDSNDGVQSMGSSDNNDSVNNFDNDRAVTDFNNFEDIGPATPSVQGPIDEATSSSLQIKFKVGAETLSLSETSLVLLDSFENGRAPVLLQEKRQKNRETLED